MSTYHPSREVFLIGSIVKFKPSDMKEILDGIGFSGTTGKIIEYLLDHKHEVISYKIKTGGPDPILYRGTEGVWTWWKTRFDLLYSGPPTEIGKASLL